MEKTTRICVLCKNRDQIDNLIHREIGDKKKSLKYVHKECYKTYIDRKDFFTYFHEVLDIPKMDRWSVMNLNTIAQSYSWEVMLHALKIKEKAMFDNFEKGYPYILAILRNQLPFSYKDIQKQKERTFYEEKSDEIIDIGKISFNKNKIDTRDYSSLLD